MKGLFIGGCERSGTTMLGSMLGAGHGVIVTPESQFVWEEFQRFILNSDITVSEIIDRISKNWRFKIWNTDIKAIKTSKYLQGFDKYSYCIEEIIKCYSQNRGLNSPKIWIDHAPHNIGHIEFLSQLLDDAKFVHIIRDGRGVASSFKNLKWGPNTIENSAKWWASNVVKGLAAEIRYSRDKLITVKYEDILLEPQKELAKICEFSGIDFNEKMLIGNSFIKPEYTKSQHSLVGEGVKKSKTESWKEVLTNREIELFEYYTSELLSYLGYSLIYGIKARAPTKLENIQSRLVVYKNMQNYIIQKHRQFTKIQ